MSRLSCAFVILLSAACDQQVVVRNTTTVCGDELIAGAEECDDGNTDSTDGCTDACKVAICGDGTLRADIDNPSASEFEACDDGNTEDDDACLSSCQLARCGDGIVRTDLDEMDPDFEACDDGNNADDDACYQCRPARCGDGQVRNDLSEDDADYEVCDDGNTHDDDQCLSNCQLARCGDGVVGPGEGCDDGKLICHFRARVSDKSVDVLQSDSVTYVAADLWISKATAKK